MTVIAVDLDNTLTDRPMVFTGWLTDFKDDHGIDDAEADRLLASWDADGFGDKPTMFGAARARWRLQPTVEELVEAFYTSMIEATFLTPDAVQALDLARRASATLLVVTNGTPRQQEKIDRLGLDELAHGVAVSGIVGARKPDSAIFAAAAHAAGTTVDAIDWVIGDSPEADIRGAFGIGARSAWLSRGRMWPLDDITPTIAVENVHTAMIAALDDAAARPTWRATPGPGG